MRTAYVLFFFGLITLTVSCGDGSANSSPFPVTSSVTSSNTFPRYNKNPISPDFSGLNSMAVQIFGRTKLGWNIGNTVEAMGGEVAWVNPIISKELIQLVRLGSFDAIRLPVSWGQHADQQTAKIDPFSSQGADRILSGQRRFG
jgi:endoglucanase